MSVTYGFHNSKNHDRRYNAAQLSRLYDGIIRDGVFMSIGGQLIVNSASGMTINVSAGKAWFNHTWTENDAILPLEISPAEAILNRIDAVVLEVDENLAVRANSIKVIKGTPSSAPTKPVLVNDLFLHQYPLAYITVDAGMSLIMQSKIENMVGKSECPFVTGILETIDIDDLIAQWNDEWTTALNLYEQEFITWFNDCKATLDENVAANLLNLINAHKADNVVHLSALDRAKFDKIDIVDFNASETTYNAGVYSVKLKKPLASMPTNFTTNLTPPTDVKNGDKLLFTDIAPVINVYGKGFRNDPTWFFCIDGSVNEDGYATIMADGTYQAIASQSGSAKTTLKPNTKYTCIIDIIKDTTHNSLEISNPTKTAECPFLETVSLNLNTTQYAKILLTTKPALTTERCLSYVLNNAAASGSFVKFRTMLLEGDWTNKEIPMEYWENTSGLFTIIDNLGELITDGTWKKGIGISCSIGVNGAVFKTGGGATTSILNSTITVDIINPPTKQGVAHELYVVGNATEYENIYIDDAVRATQVQPCVILQVDDTNNGCENIVETKKVSGKNLTANYNRLPINENDSPSWEIGNFEKGKVVNLYGKGLGDTPTAYAGLPIGVTQLSNGYMRFTQQATPVNITVATTKKANDVLLPNKTYTIVVDVIENTNTNANLGVTLSLGTSGNYPFTTTLSVGRSSDGIGIKKYLVTTENPIDITAPLLRPFMDISATGIITLRIMLLEGDWTYRDIPMEYWENTYYKQKYSVKQKPPVVLSKKNGVIDVETAYMHNGASWYMLSQKGSYMLAMFNTAPYVRIMYRTNGVTMTSHLDLDGIGEMTNQAVFCLEVSSDNKWYVIGHAYDPYILIYFRQGDVFTRIAKPSQLVGMAAITSVAFSKDNTKVAFGTAGGAIYIFSISGNTLTFVKTIYTNGFTVTNVKFTTTRLVATADASNVDMFTFDLVNFNKTAQNIVVTNSDIYNRCLEVFSDNGKEYAVALCGDNYARLCELGATAITVSLIGSMSFYATTRFVQSVDTKHYVGYDTVTNLITLYVRNGTTFTKSTTTIDKNTHFSLDINGNLYIANGSLWKLTGDTLTSQGNFTMPDVSNLAGYITPAPSY